MFCPSCGAEYREGFARCADCDEPLAATAPASDAEEHGADGPVVVARVHTLAEAEVAVELLRGAGLDARLRDEHMARIHWLAVPAIGGIGIETDRASARLALEILESSEAAVAIEPELAPAAGGDADSGPDYLLRRKRWFGWITFVLFAAPVALLAPLLLPLRGKDSERRGEGGPPQD